MDRKYSRLLCRAIPNSSITCPPSPAIMRLRRVRFSNGATNLYWVRLYTAQYATLTLRVNSITFFKIILILQVLKVYGSKRCAVLFRDRDQARQYSDCRNAYSRHFLYLAGDETSL